MADISRFIAVVDDDSSILSALRRLLRARSWTAATFQSGLQFLASLTDRLPDCLILDLQMPGMSGLEVQQALARKNIKIPTIIITSNSDVGMRERCIAAGAAAYLLKPIRCADLFTAIEAAVASCDL
jgi:FixJ family two-component response regulator